MKITQEQLDNMLRLHNKWLNREEDGERLDLSHKNASNLKMQNAKMQNANMQGANMQRAKMRWADKALKLFVNGFHRIRELKPIK